LENVIVRLVKLDSVNIEDLLLVCRILTILFEVPAIFVVGM